jgi:hypothetical protein
MKSIPFNNLIKGRALFKKIVWFSLAILVIDGIYDFSRGPTGQSLPEPPGPKTPSSLKMAVNSIDVAFRFDTPYKNLFNIPNNQIDVVGQTGLFPGDQFGISSTLEKGDYKAIRVTLEGAGTYAGINPCDGTLVTDSVLHLPEGDNGPVVMNFMEPHPVTGLQAGYTQIQHFTVGSTSLEFRLVYRASNSVICASSDPPLIDTTISEGLSVPEGIALDPVNHEIAVTNSDVSTLEIYNPYTQTSLRSIVGTGLNKPIGVYIDPVNDEIGVANSGNHSITVYNRAIPTLLRTLIGDATKLSSPAGVALNTSGEIVVTNGGNNSVTFYNRTDQDNHAPKYTLTGTSTGLSTPCGIAIDGTLLFVTNNRNDSVTIYDETDVSPAFLGQLIGNVVLPPDGETVVAGVDTLSLRLNGDTVDRTITFDASVTTEDGYEVAAQIQRLVQALSVDPSVQSAYTGFTASFDGSKYTLMSGASGSNSAVIVTGGTKATAFKLTQGAGGVQTGSSNVSPRYTISGAYTGLSNPCGIYVDTAHNEIGVVNSGTNTITIYDHLANGNVAPLRTVRGSATTLTNPAGIYLDPDPQKDEIGVVNRGNGTVTFYKRKYSTVQLKELPLLKISPVQQHLFPQYFYIGIFNGGTGVGYQDSIAFDGNSFDWQVTDARLRQVGDATGTLSSPNDGIFLLLDGEFKGALPLGCAQLSNFLILHRSTDCTLPRILFPTPVASGNYHVTGVLFKQNFTSSLSIPQSVLTESEFPRPVPTLSLSGGAITGITWVYLRENIDPNQPPDIYPNKLPMINSQDVQILLNGTYGDVSAIRGCQYTQVQGNSQNLIYDSGTLPPKFTYKDSQNVEHKDEPVRSLPGPVNSQLILNNGCKIYVSDVQSITFTLTDALDTHYVFNWQPN